MRVVGGPVGLLASTGIRGMPPTETDRLSVTVQASVRTVLGRYQRRCTTSAAWEISRERSIMDQALSLNASIPMGRAFRLELSADVPIGVERSGESMEWLLRVRNTGPIR
jgi:hypothetical protein